MQNYHSELQLCSSKANSYKSLYKDKPPSLLITWPLLKACDIRLDISRQRISSKQIEEMQGSALATGVFAWQKAMMNGAFVNSSEGRQALHTLLREPTGEIKESKEVQSTLYQLKAFAEAIRNEEILGSKGKPFTDVINIGIGGSDTGPRFVCSACQTSNEKNLRIHWISNVDSWVLYNTLSQLNPETTLVIVSSKSFNTAETLLNAEVVKQWFLDHHVIDLENHFVLCSANPEAPSIINIPKAYVFKFWNWVGGRFSVWSSVGLPILLAIGINGFDELLSGAHDMDMHAKQAPVTQNIPLTLALLSIWNTTAIGTTSHCFLPYEYRLRLMVQWLQQLEMESLGKSRLIDGSLTKYPTCTPVWGGIGNDAQHAFYQCLRQGTNRTSIDIVTADASSQNSDKLHSFLLANAKAQSNALVSEDLDSLAINCLSVINLPDLSPYHIGALMALYEHKTTMSGFLLGLNPFDQPGVELGKKLAQEIWNEDSNAIGR